MYINQLIVALYSRNYRLFVIGNSISNIGSLIEYIALSWLVYRLTNSATYVGILFFISQISIFLISPFSGILADRIPRLKLLIITNLVTALISLILGILIMCGSKSLLLIFSTQIIAGLTKGIDNPVRNTLVNDLIDKPEQLVNAISINSSIFNIAKIIGPTLAAILIPWAGEGICFLINSISFLSIIIALFMMKLKPQFSSRNSINIFEDLKEGFIYSVHFSPVRTIIVFVSLIGLFCFSLNIILPVYAKEVLQGGADTFGFITTYSGIGALFAALFMATKRNALGLDFTIFIAALIFSSGYFLLSLISNFMIASIVVVFIGFGQVLIFASASSILQTLSENDKMGRVIGLYFMFFMACTTLGSLLVGKLSDTVGPALTIKLISGLTIAIAILYGSQIKYVRKKSLRRFIKLGIDPVHLRNDKFNFLNNNEKIQGSRTKKSGFI